MKRLMAITLMSLSGFLLLANAAPARADRWNGGDIRRPVPVPLLDGTWCLNGNPEAVCEIVQRRPDGRALFINEHGSRAWGELRGDRVWIPDWSDGVSDGLSGRIRGDRIIWPDGSYWSR